MLRTARRAAARASRTPPAAARPHPPCRARALHSSAARRHGEITPPAPGTGITVHFRDAKGAPLKTILAAEGDDLLSLAHAHGVDLEGACEGSVACSTCHVVLDGASFAALPAAGDDENDMLDMAFGLAETSRLACQVRVARAVDGMVATLPAATRNMFVDGKKASH